MMKEMIKLHNFPTKVSYGISGKWSAAERPRLPDIFYLNKQKQVQRIHVTKQISGTYIIFQNANNFKHGPVSLFHPTP